MKLITKELAALFKKYPLYSQENDKNPVILAKYFTPWSNWTWYVLEADECPNGDWRFFGYVQGAASELGYFMFSDLQSVKGPGGISVERDLYFSGKLADVMK